MKNVEKLICNLSIFELEKFTDFQMVCYVKKENEKVCTKCVDMRNWKWSVWIDGEKLILFREQTKYQKNGNLSKKLNLRFKRALDNFSWKFNDIELFWNIKWRKRKEINYWIFYFHRIQQKVRIVSWCLE